MVEGKRKELLVVAKNEDDVKEVVSAEFSDRAVEFVSIDLSLKNQLGSSKSKIIAYRERLS